MKNDRGNSRLTQADRDAITSGRLRTRGYYGINRRYFDDQAEASRAPEKQAPTGPSLPPHKSK